MKILKLSINRCGDCLNIAHDWDGTWKCTILNERVNLITIPLFCPLEDDVSESKQT